MLKPIPQENPENIRQNTAKKARRFMKMDPRGKPANKGKFANAGDEMSGLEPSARLDSDFFADGPGVAAGAYKKSGGAGTVPDGFDDIVCNEREKLTTEQKFLCKINRKLQSDAKKDRNLIKSVCMRMINFVRKNGRTSAQEVGDLIHGLKRSVLSLERQRQRDFNKQRRRKKK